MSLPKGTRLAGSVKESVQGKVILHFDRAVILDGSQIPIQGLIRAMGAPVTAGNGVFSNTSGNFGEYGSPAAPPPGARPVPLSGALQSMPQPRDIVTADGGLVGTTYFGMGVVAYPATGDSKVFSISGGDFVLGPETRLTVMLSVP